jgi:succinate-acetate transporter protein
MKGASMTAVMEKSPAVAPALTDGTGVYFPKMPAGISLQLGALSIVLGLLSAAYAELFDPAATGIVIPVAFSIGAVVIFTGGLINFRAGIMVAGVIGCLYGAFWLSMGLLLQFKASELVTTAGAPAFGDALGTYLLIWGVMSAALCLPVMYVSKVVLTQQALLAVVFFVLAFGAFAADGTSWNKLGGWLGIVDALLCLYISTTLVTNETAGKPVLPLP